MQTFAEEVTPTRGLKASLGNVGDAYTLDEAVPAGVIVIPTTEGHCELPDSSGDVALALGVVVYDPATEAPSASVDFASGDVVEVCNEGRIWCVAEAGLAVGNQPYCRYASGAGGTQLGALRADADTNTAALLPNARVVAVTTGLAKIAINLPHGAAS